MQREDEKQPRLQVMPKTDGDIVALLKLVTDENTVVYMEAVSGFIGKPHPGSRMFTFGHGVGVIHGALTALERELHIIRPQRWQAALGLGVSTGDKTKWKNKLKAEAQRLYPRNKITLATADALLILHHAKSIEWSRNTTPASPIPFHSLTLIGTDKCQASTETLKLI